MTVSNHKSSPISGQPRPLHPKPNQHSLRQIPIIRFVGNLRGNDPEDISNRARFEAIKWLRNRSPGFPDEAINGNSFDHPVPGAHTSVVRLQIESLDFWAARLDYSADNGVWVTEQLIAINKEDLSVSYGLRLTLSTREENPIYSATIPGVLRQIVEKVGMSRNGRDVSLFPGLISKEEEVNSLVDLITDRRRKRPIIVASLAEDEEKYTSSYPIDMHGLARKTVGLSHVYMITGPAAFILSDRLGKPLSVFNRAIRTYRPGLNFEDVDPYQHPIAMRHVVENWDGIGGKAFEDYLVQMSALESIKQFDPERDVPGFLAIKTAATESRRKEALEEQKKNVEHTQPNKEIITLYESEIADLDKNAKEWQQLALGEEDSRRKMEIERDQLKAQVAWMRDRIDHLESVDGKEMNDARNPLLNIPEAYKDIKDWTDKYYSGRIVLSSRATRALKNAEFSDIGLVCKCISLLGSGLITNK